MENRIRSLFQIELPIVQAGMIWCSGWRLASAASNAGCLGLIGAGSMYPDVLQLHIQRCKAATNKPFGVNVPLLYPDIDQLMKVIIAEGVKIVFTSAGNPKTYTSMLQHEGIKVVHVVSNLKFALKAQDAGVDAIVAEGFEAGGHNGREETTTLVLIPLIREKVEIPLIAAGGIGSGSAILAAQALGADGVQIGSLFASAKESSAHPAFKQAIVEVEDGGTQLALKSLTPVRLIKNDFFQKVAEAENRGATTEELKELLGRARAKKGMFEGDMIEGELEIGQVAALINEQLSVQETVNKLQKEYINARKQLSLSFL